MRVGNCFATPVRGTAARLLPIDIDAPASWAEHEERYGPLPELAGQSRSLLAAIEKSGLRGRGGAGFPTAVKARAVAVGRSPIVVANGTEGEPASAKDKVLLRENPHLVIDGVLAAMAAVGAREAIVAASQGAHASRASLEAALDGRPSAARAIRVAAVPERFVAGEESALVHWLNGGDAKPTLTPPRPFEQGVRGRPTLVQNVETIANIGLIARYGADWFREAGTGEEPGTVLVTMGGAVRRPGVIEVELGTPLRQLIELAGGLTMPPRALLVGGDFGTWIAAAGTLDTPLSERGLRPLGASLGARTIFVLPSSACGVLESARVARYLAGESAGQCGPCVFGLPAVADAMEAIASGTAGAAAALERLPRLKVQIAHRGACAHPDGALRFVDSALTVFTEEIAHHVAGHCTASHAEPVLPTVTHSDRL